VIPSINESAKWVLFAVKADDARRRTYGRWLTRLRRAETRARQDAAARLPVPAIEIPAGVGHSSSDGRSLSGVDAVVEDVRHIRATIFRTERGDGKPYLIDYPIRGLDAASPLLQFALSDQVVGPAARYLGMVPILTGITVLASPYVGAAPFAGSQLFHSDWEDRRQVKVFVHCTDVAEENGPLTAVAAAASVRVKEQVHYHYGGPHFRLPDDEVLPRVDGGEVTAFTGPAEAVTFIDTSSCLHLGSRLQPGAAERLVVQFQFLTPAAFDLQLSRRRRARPFADVTGDFSPVQRLVLGATR
jgi:hypothetical protein